MRAAVFSALVAGAMAGFHRDPFRHHHGCGNREFFPDYDSFHFPGRHHDHNRHWDLCRNDHFCRPEESFGRVDFEFEEDNLVFDFRKHEKREEIRFEEVEIFLSTGERRFDDAHRFGSHRGHCHRGHGFRDPFRCRLPFHDLVKGGHHGFCPNKHHEALIFFIKIRTVVRIREERFELFSRSHNHRRHHGHHHHGHGHHGHGHHGHGHHGCHHHLPRGEFGRDGRRDGNFCHREDDHFNINVKCRECRKQEYNKDIQVHKEHDHRERTRHSCPESHYCPREHFPCHEKHHCRPEEREHEHHHCPERHYCPREHFPCHEKHHCRPEEHHHPPKYHNHHHPHIHEHHRDHYHHHCPPRHFCPKEHHPCKERHHCRPEREHHGHDDGLWYPGKYEDRVRGHENHEHCGHCPDRRCHRRPNHPHYARSFNHHRDFECSGAFIKAFGQGHHGHHLHELERDGFHGCGREDGIFHRFPRSDLEVSVRGPITHNHREFGFFRIRIEKRGDRVLIVIRIKVHDVRFIIAEAAAFVECDGGRRNCDTADIEHPSICRPDSYPHRYHNNHHRDEFELEVVERQRCHGDYFIAIWVLVCVKDGHRDCHWRHERHPHHY